MVHAVEKPDRRQGGLGEGHDDLPQDGHVGGAVHLGRFDQRGGNLLEVPHHDDEVVDVHRLVEDHRPEAPHQADLLDHHVFGDEPRLENHHHDDEDLEEALEGQLGSGEGERRHRGDGEVEQRAHDGDEDRVQDAPDEERIRRQDAVVHQGEALGHDGEAPHLRHPRRIGKREREEVQEGHEDDHADGDQEDRDRDSPGELAGWGSYFAHHQSPFPVTLIDPLWAPTMSTRPIAPLKRLAAVEMEYCMFWRPMRYT